MADALEAMTSDRVHEPGRSVGDALHELERGAGTQFDGALVAVAAELAREGGLPLGDGVALAC